MAEAKRLEIEALQRKVEERKRELAQIETGSLGHEAATSPQDKAPARKRGGGKDSKVAKNSGTVPLKKTSKQHSKKSRQTEATGGWDLALVVLLVVAWIGHKAYLHMRLENEKFFSMLTDTEREASFQSEQVWYYGFYKMVSGDLEKGLDLSKAMARLMAENTTEYPTTINALERFNVYPEVAVGVLRHGYISLNALLHPSSGPDTCYGSCTCFSVKDEDGTSITTCTGLGHPIYFYIECVFHLAGLHAAALLYLCYELGGGTLASAVVGLVFFAFNHENACRYMWAPPLRESFSFPFFVLQMAFVVKILRARTATVTDLIVVTCATFFFAISWQLSQFALLTQSTALCGVFLLGYVPARLHNTLQGATVAGFLPTIALMMGNTLSVNALFLQFAVSALGGAFAAGDGQSLAVRVMTGVAILGSTGFLRALISAISGGVRDGGHIIALLMANMGLGPHDFHTKLYACAPEFLPMTTEYFDMSETLLFPTCVAVAIRVLYLTTVDFWGIVNVPAPGVDTPTRQAQPEHVYMFLQTIWFTVMAGLFMRLKLFWTTGIIAMASIAASKSFVCSSNRGRQLDQRIPHTALIGLLLAGSAVTGWEKFYNPFFIEDQWQSPEMVELVSWAKTSTQPTEAFAGTMSITSFVWAVAERPIVNHAHYETVKMRNITLDIYKMHSRMTDRDFWGTLRSLSVTYLIVDQDFCGHKWSQGEDPRFKDCGIITMMDTFVLSKSRGMKPFCMRWSADSTSNRKSSNRKTQLFREVYSNDRFVVLSVLPPKRLDTQILTG